MKQLIELFNKKYGATYGIIDDSIDNEDVYKVYKMIKTLCSDDQEIMEMLNKIKLPSPRTAKESIEKVNINVSGGLSKEYVDDKTEILPVKNNYIIFEDAVPRLMEDTATYGTAGFDHYIFDSLQNEDMIISAVKYNLNVTFNDGTNDITKDLIIDTLYNGNGNYENEDFYVEVLYSKTDHVITMTVYDINNNRWCSVLRATLNCDTYSNLLQDYHIENIDYDKIKGVPTALNRIANYKDFTLEGKEYYELYDNLSIWDANKFNERLDENSGVKRNEFFKLLGEDKYTMRIKQKDSEGIGFGQHISIDNSKNVHIVADAGVDVIIKIYNSTTKELIRTLNYCEAGFYKTRVINKDYLNGVTSIFIAFTVKDSTESFYGNTYVNDLIVHYDSSFLVKEEILTKTNTKEYIPTGDYNPATKKYVDDNTQLCWLEDYEATGDKSQYADINVSSLTSRVFYAFNFKKHPGVTTVRLLKSYGDGTIKSIINLGSTLEYMYLMNISSSIMKFYLKYATGIVSECVCRFGNTSDECTFKRTPMVLYAKNTYEYTPTEDYNPATKKYVDDKFIALDLMETVGTIPQSELQKCNNGTSRYVSSIDFDTLFSEPNNYMYYATYKDDTLIPIDYQSNLNRMVTMELDSVDGLGVHIGFDYGTHMMYPFNGGNASIKAYTFTNDLIIKRCPLINANIIATKEYVNERVGNSVITVNNVNDSLTLTTDKNQYATLAVPVEIILPTVTSFTELHLFFSGSEGVTIGTTNVKWESQVTIENNKSYEIIFTYVNESIGWLGKTIVYS